MMANNNDYLFYFTPYSVLYTCLIPHTAYEPYVFKYEVGITYIWVIIMSNVLREGEGGKGGRQAAGLEVGKEAINMRSLLDWEHGTDRRLASVSEIDLKKLAPGKYWVNNDSWGLEIRKGVWRGIPTKAWVHCRNNGDGTYTEISLHDATYGIPASERLEVRTTEAGPRGAYTARTLLEIGPGDLSPPYMIVSAIAYEGSTDRLTARVLSVPKEQVSSKAAKQEEGSHLERGK
jgi:hypothetical protein